MLINLHPGEFISVSCDGSEKVFTIICRMDEVGIWFSCREFKKPKKFGAP